MVRTQVIKFNDFMAGENRPEKKHDIRPIIKSALLATGTAIISMPKHSFAATTTSQAIAVNAVPSAVKSQIVHAFDPLVDLIVSLSIPISSVMIAGAALMIMIGQKEKGYSLLMNCAIGYCLVQMTPLFIKLLTGIGSAIVG
ncbi:hypothetical protein PU629_06550 [Pullulanibacillus sp. KACC 23026]|uniref:hypothetical protein n=1 Tax=Pullulanibacillus sp. KACC 23026 TaxID=3028315 RepID=UPI0023B101A9|nr:hypothetical protein [Pullulanibacillus sp. KACC 23026]WEG14024.1 hypothetical protein PU629_06550 [Pullulanibacillus sp. KACC 23026]